MACTIIAVQPTMPAMVEVTAGTPVATEAIERRGGWVQIPEHPSDYRFFSSGRRPQTRTIKSE